MPGEAQAGKPFKHVFKNNCVNIVCPEDARLGDTIKVVMTTGRGVTKGKPTKDAPTAPVATTTVSTATVVAF